MSYSNGVVTRPVLLTSSGGDIGQALGIARDNVRDLILDGSINMWAKYKPVRYATELDTGESAPARQAGDWWKAYNGLCGLTIPTSTNTSSGPGTSSSAWYKLLNSQLMWGYEKPNGGTYPYRQNDFDGYNHNAQPHFAFPAVSSFMVQSNGDLTITFEENAGDSRTLGLGDIKPGGTALSSYYFGVLIYYSNSLYTFKATSRASLSSGQVTFSNMAADYAGKRVTIVPFLASGSLAQGTSGNVTIVSCNLAPVQVDILPYTSGIAVAWDACEWDSAKTKVSYSISLINTTASSKTVYNIYIKLRDNTQQLYSRHIFSVTVPAGQTVFLASGDTSQTYDPNQDYYMSIETSDGITIPYEEMQVEESA